MDRAAPPGKHHQRASEREHQWTADELAALGVGQEPRRDRDQRHADESRQHAKLYREQIPRIRRRLRLERHTVECGSVEDMIVFTVHRRALRSRCEGFQ